VTGGQIGELSAAAAACASRGELAVPTPTSVKDKKPRPNIQISCFDIFMTTSTFR